MTKGQKYAIHELSLKPMEEFMNDDPVPRRFMKGHFYKCVCFLKTNFLDITACTDWIQNKAVPVHNSIFSQFLQSKLGNSEFFISKENTAKSSFVVDHIKINHSLLFSLVNAESEVAKF